MNLQKNTDKVQILRTNFNEAIQAFKSHLNFCILAIHTDHEYPAWADTLDHTSSDTSRTTICKAISQIEYQDQQDPREVIFCPGLLGCSNQTLELAKQLNLAKDRLKETLQAMDLLKIAITNSDNGRIMQRPLSKVALEEIGLARLHRWQSWRHLLVFEQCPSHIGFTWAHTKKVRRVTAEQAYIKLEKINRDDPYIKEQMSRLSHLPLNEPLAEVIPATTHLRANIVWDDHGTITRKQVRTSLPILFPSKPNGTLPRFSQIRQKPENDNTRLKRMDIKLEEDAFLPSVHIYRYLPKYRTKL